MSLEAIQVGLIVSIAIALAFIVHRMVQLHRLYQKSDAREAERSKTAALLQSELPPMGFA